MKLRIAYSLLLDALYQVLDDKVFRVLAIMVGVAVLVPILVAFRQEEVVVLFGVGRYPYEQVFDAVGPLLGYPPGALTELSGMELRETIIDGYQELIAGGLFGTVGILLCLAATSFFIPRMLEKGTADTVFSKPVSRLTLLLARYVAGILFVGILGGSLVVGTHLALLFGAGYSDAAFLWTVPALVYKFAVVYAFTVLIAVVSRSTVAALILTILFVPLNGCVHLAWNGIQMGVEMEQGRDTKQEGGDPDALEESSPSQEEDLEPTDGLGRFMTFVYHGFQYLHYSLPKTNDALAIANKLRASLVAEEEPEFALPDLEFVLVQLPESFRALPPGSWAALETLPPAFENDELVYAAAEGGSASSASFAIRLRPARELSIGTSGRTRLESDRTAASDFEKWIESDPSRALLVDETDTLADGTTWTRAVRRLDWTSTVGAETRHVRTLILDEAGSILTLELSTPAGWLEEHPDVERWFGGRNFAFETEAIPYNDPSAWYAAKLDWDAPWRFNIFFSLGTSIGFAALMLALAWWRLTRLDF